MPNKLLTLAEVVDRIAGPWLEIIRDDLKARPLADGEERVYPNPFRDCVPLVVTGPLAVVDDAPEDLHG